MRMQIDVPNCWYLFTYEVEIPIKWEGKEIDESSVSPDERRQVNELLNKYWAHLERDMYKQGSYDFSCFWCAGWTSIVYGGNRRGHAFLLPKREDNLRFLLEKKAELARIRDTCKSVFPEEFKAVRDAFDQLHPIGHMLIMEARIVFLPGQEEEMMREAAEAFRDIRGDEYLRIIASKDYGWLKREVDLNVGKSILEYMRIRDELAFKARYAKYKEILEHIKKGDQTKAIRKLRAMRKGDWYHVEPGISKEAEQDDSDRWYVIAGYLKTKGEEPVRAVPSEPVRLILEEERDRVLKALDLAEPPPLGPLLSRVVPELCLGAWFDTATVIETKYQDASGIIGRRIIGLNRLGCHMNYFWCSSTQFEYSQGRVSIQPNLGGPYNIKGPYMIPRGKGVLQMLSEKRLLLKEVVRTKAQELELDALDIKPMVLIFEVKSPWLGQPDDKETTKIREWFNRARNVGVRETARNVNKVGVKQMPEEDFIRYLGDVVEWTADVSPWVENQRRMIEEAREKKNQVKAESLSVELRDKVKVMESILSIVELHESAYPRWADKVSGGFAEQVEDAMDKAKRVVAEEEASRIRLEEEKLAELKRWGVEVRIRIEANSAKDPYERAHGMTIDRSLRGDFWDTQEDAGIGAGATPYTRRNRCPTPRPTLHDLWEQWGVGGLHMGCKGLHQWQACRTGTGFEAAEMAL